MSEHDLTQSTPLQGSAESNTAEPLDVLQLLRSKARLLLLGPLAIGAAAAAISFAIPPTYTASTTFMPPQQSAGGGAASAALASLGALGGLAGSVAGISTPGDRYVSLLQSVTLSDRIIDKFKLMEVYDEKLKVEARLTLAKKVRINLGKKDGLITVDFDDKVPARAADIANAYVDELRKLTGTIAMTEAQQRRMFFERQLQQTREQLVKAQSNLQGSGFNAGALKSEPKAAAEAYARLKAELTAAQTRLQLLRVSLADDTPEVRQQQSIASALHEQLAKAEQATDNSAGADYVGKYRDFKYQEALFEVYARQFELARADESREGALIQVIDPATPPERKSAPRRTFIAIGATVSSALLIFLWLLIGPLLRSNAARREQI